MLIFFSVLYHHFFMSRRIGCSENQAQINMVYLVTLYFKASV